MRRNRLFATTAALVCCAGPAAAQMQPGVSGGVGSAGVGGSVGAPALEQPMGGAGTPGNAMGPPPAPPLHGRFGSAVPGTGPAARTPSFYVVPRGEVALTYTDNVAVSNFNQRSDLIVSPSAGLAARGQTAHTRLNLDGSVSYDFYKNTTSFNGARFNGIGDIRAELVDRFLDLDGRFATNQEPVSVFGPAPASDRSFGLNQAQVLSYGLTPTARWRFGGLVNAEASYDFSAVNYFQPTASARSILFGDYYSNTGHIKLSNGHDFSRLGWSLEGSVQHQDQADYISNNRNGALSLFYALWPDFQAVATGGYDDIENPSLRESASGGYATGGFRWALSRRTHVDFDGGWRYRAPYFNANVRYSSSPALNLNATYTDSIDSPQSLISQNLVDLLNRPLPTGATPQTPAAGPNGLSPGLAPNTGASVNPGGSAIGSPNFNPLGINTQAFRRHAVTVGIDGVVGRNTYRLNGVYERLTTGPLKGDAKRGMVMVARQITLNLRASVTASYNRVTGFEFFPGLTAKTTQARAGLDYAIGRRTNVSLAYVYQRIQAFPTNSRENVVVLALTRGF